MILKSKIAFNRQVVFMAFAMSMALFLSSCGGDDAGPSSNYELVWEDNFEGSEGASPDATKWTYDIGTGSNGWGNSELQYYTDRPENVSLDGDGNLVIKAIEESYEGKAYTSARIKTQGLFDQKYGKVEARLKTPYGQGLWPAFWMLGADIEQVGWPQCGEIDLMELRGQFPATIAGSIHGPGYSAGGAVGKSYTLSDSRFDNDFHVFAIEWTEDYIDFFVDGRKYQRIVPGLANGEWVFDDSFFMILNVAVGGNYVGSPNASTRFPQRMVVDYVRVYQEIDG